MNNVTTNVLPQTTPQIFLSYIPCDSKDCLKITLFSLSVISLVVGVLSLTHIGVFQHIGTGAAWAFTALSVPLLLSACFFSCIFRHDIPSSEMEQKRVRGDLTKEIPLLKEKNKNKHEKLKYIQTVINENEELKSLFDEIVTQHKGSLPTPQLPLENPNIDNPLVKEWRSLQQEAGYLDKFKNRLCTMMDLNPEFGRKLLAAIDFPEAKTLLQLKSPTE